MVPALLQIQRILLLILVLGLSACHWMTVRQMDEKYGEPKAISRISDNPDTLLFHKAEHILEQRCVVCHACYDAPCQLKLTSIEGIDRGANKTEIYDGYRLLAASPPHFFEDGEGRKEWREQEFFPVLNEREQSPENNLALSVMYQMLKLKNKHPLPEGAVLPDSFDFKLKRDQYCPKIEEFGDYKKEHPLWGMPYGLPRLDPQEFSVLEDWIRTGAKVPLRAPLPLEIQAQVSQWEEFFNGTTIKEKLVNRYFYEHLYLAHLYFNDVDKTRFFRMVRSYTPSGQPIRVMPSRRPYDAPLNDVFYYRLQEVSSIIVAKTHMPYALDKKRYNLWQKLFYETEYTVEKLPGYDVETSSNPFIVFEDIPMVSRYKFLLEEAQFSIMNFIKGPVCRGQIALNVINDYFWVVFANPDLPSLAKEEKFLRENKELLRFPAHWESNVAPWSWMDLAKRQKNYIQQRADFINNNFGKDVPVTLDNIWSGDNGNNPNAALTIFRHSDSATVIQGFAGHNPQTAWVIDYPLLERIHYLLVAGFDVNGNVVHQLITRLSMDFLRMEGEANFIAMLPKSERKTLQDSWYEGAEENVQEYFDGLLNSLVVDSAVPFKGNDHKNELLGMLATLTNAKRYAIDQSDFPGVDIQSLINLNGNVGKHLSFLPQTAFLEVVGKDRSYWFSLIHHDAHQNKTHVITDNDVRIPEKDSLTVLPDIAAAYPNAIYRVKVDALPDFVSDIKALSSEADYRLFMTNFGMRRTNPQFWAVSDELHRFYKQSAGLEYGLLDYNRLENR